jgi:hypothetical protein
MPITGELDFRTFAFKATGGLTDRNMPDRLADITNVREYWNGVGDPTSAIQAAIDYRIAHGGGIVFFPPGSYNLTAVLICGSNTNDVGVQFIGCGWGASMIAFGVPPTNSWILSSGGRTYDCIERVEALSIAVTAGPTVVGGGALKLTRPRAQAIGVEANGWFGIDASQCDGALLYNCHHTGPGHSTAEVNDGYYNHGYCPIGSIGFQLGNFCRCVGSRGTASHIAASLSGDCPSLEQFSPEVNDIAVRVGWNSAAAAGSPDAATARGATVAGCFGERLGILIELYDCEGGIIRNNTATGQDNVMEWAANTGVVTNMVWSASTVTVTTVGAHNLPTQPVALFWNTGNQQWLTFAPASQIVATRTGSNTFTYPLAADPGAFKGSTGTMSWALSGGSTANTNAATASGNTLNFASVSGSVVPGMVVINNTHPGSITGGTTVLSKTSTTVVLSQNVASTVSSGDSITIGNPVVTVPITTSVAIPNGQSITLSGMSASWNPSGAGGGVPFAVAVTGGASGSPGNFTYAGPTVVPSGTSSGTWSLTPPLWKYSKEYVLRIRRCYETVVSGLTGSMSATIAGIDMDYGFSVINGTTSGVGDAAVDSRNCVMESVSPDVSNQGLVLPTDKKKGLAGWKFLQYTGQVHSPTLIVTTVASPRGQLLFSELPGNSGVTQPQFETDEYDIRDGAKSGGGTAAWNDQVQGGSSGHYKVRTDGTNWFRIG